MKKLVIVLASIALVAALSAGPAARGPGLKTPGTLTVGLS